MSALAKHRTKPAGLAGRAVLAVQSDARLSELAAEGHERAFDVLVERYRRPLVRYCARILPESRAEDAVQQAFINAHAALARGDVPSDFRPWLYRVAHNAAVNMLRQNGWSYDQIPADIDGVPRPDQVVEQKIELERTVSAIGELPERQRRALVMKELEGRSYAEIALALGAGDGAVRQLLNRARMAVRSAATMITPPPLVVRVATSYPGDGSRSGRAAEIIGGLGAGGAVKAGATALVAGSLVVGAVKAPAPFIGHHDKVTSEKSPAARMPVERSAPAAAATEIADTRAGRAGGRGRGSSGEHPRRNGGQGSSGRGRHGRSGAVAPAEDRRHSEPGDDRGGALAPRENRSGSDDGGRTRRHSGSDDATSEHSGSGGSDDTTADDHSGSGTSGSGSDDDTLATTVETNDDSGSSGTSGGSSGEGSGTLTTTSPTSGSDDGVSSGSGSSGSSGSDD
jgi:RNA polymerase sigma factor (sigma-70 family)